MRCFNARVIVVAALLSTTSSALAEAPDRARAQELFEQGLEAAHNGEFETAVDAFARSYTLYPHPGTLTNLALYQQETGRLVEAHRSWSELLERYGEAISGPARERAVGSLEELDAELATLSIVVSPDGAAIILDEETTGPPASDGRIRVMAGRHVVEARLAGHETERIDLALEAGEHRDVMVTLQPARGTLVVECEPEGASVTVDGAQAGSAPIRQLLEQGEHEIAIRAEGYMPQVRRVSLSPGSEVVVSVTLTSIPVEEESPEPVRERSAWSRPWPWVIIGVAVLVVAVAVALGVVLSQSDSDEPAWTLGLP